MAESVVEVRGLGRSFGNKAALQNVDLSVPRGCVLGLVGENGAGKTTLVKHLLGLLTPQTGEVRVFGRDPVGEPVEVLRRIGYLSEDRDLPDWMRVDELLRYTRAFFPDWNGAFAAELIETFQLSLDQKVKSLSRGQRARVGLLLALAHRPDLLLLDEPSSGLDPIVRRDILGAIIRTVADEGRTVLFSSHLLDEVQRVADRIVMLHQGQVVLSDSLDNILGTHDRMTIRLPNSLDHPPAIPAALRCEGSGREWTLLVNGQRDALARQLEACQAEVVERRAPSLEEVFVARVSS